MLKIFGLFTFCLSDDSGHVLAVTACYEVRCRHPAALQPQMEPRYDVLWQRRFSVSAFLHYHFCKSESRGLMNQLKREGLFHEVIERNAASALRHSYIMFRVSAGECGLTHTLTNTQGDKRLIRRSRYSRTLVLSCTTGADLTSCLALTQMAVFQSPRCAQTLIHLMFKHPRVCNKRPLTPFFLFS